jgi:NADH pyrophosphatase NudC (nudix superfamily)
MFCCACGRSLARLPPTVCSFCGIAHWNDAKPCASALVVRDSQLLMVRRAQEPWRNRWDVPGGFCEPGEHPIRGSLARRHLSPKRATLVS